MGLERNSDREIVFECDSCHDLLETDYTGFPDALSILQSSGWSSLKQSSDWAHYCPDCKALKGEERKEKIEAERKRLLGGPV